MNATIQMEGVNKCAQTPWVAFTAAATVATSERDQIAVVRVILFDIIAIPKHLV